MNERQNEDNAIARADTDGWHTSESEDRGWASVINRFTIGALVVSPPIVAAIHRELNWLHPTIEIDRGEVENILVKEVINQEVLRGEPAMVAQSKVQTDRSGQQIRRAELQVTTSDQDSSNVAGDPADSER